jgi:hypothetical protein
VENPTESSSAKGNRNEWNFKYTCECNDTRCRRTLAISQDVYRRLSAQGNVVHSDHAIVESGARQVAQVHDRVTVRSQVSEGYGLVLGEALAATLEVKPSPRIRAW